MLPGAVYDDSGREWILIGKQSIDEFPAAATGRVRQRLGCIECRQQMSADCGSSIIVIASNKQVLILACSITHHKYSITGLWSFH